MNDRKIPPFVNVLIKAIAGIFIVGALTAAFYFSPIPTGDDWQIFQTAALRILHGENPYRIGNSFTLFSNPPWLALLVSPLSLLPIRWGWSLLVVIGLILAIFLAKKLNLDMVKLICLILSPPFLYTLIHGQIDVIVVCSILLPREWWIIAGLTKPQTIIGLAFGALRSNYLRTAVITVAFLLGSLVLFGLWPLDLVNVPKTYAWSTHNIWLGLWPFQVPVGVAIALRGIEQKKDSILLAASPFFLPYATTGNLLGLWLATCMQLSKWQVLIILITWWLAVLFRAL